MNHVVLIGRLVRDPDAKYANNGTAITRFTLAVNRMTKNEKQQNVDFIDVVTWQKLAETCANNLEKGRLVAVTGRLQVRSYEGDDGIKHKISEVAAREVQFLDRKKESFENEDPF